MTKLHITVYYTEDSFGDETATDSQCELYEELVEKRLREDFPNAGIDFAVENSMVAYRYNDYDFDDDEATNLIEANLHLAFAEWCEVA